MAAQARIILGDNNQMACTGRDTTRTPGTQVGLAGLVGLDDIDHQRAERIHAQPPSSAHRTTAKVSAMKPATMSRSAVVLFC